MKKIIVAIIALLPFYAHSMEVASGEISFIITSTAIAGIPAGYTEFALKNHTFIPPCNNLFIKPEDKNSLAILLSAQAQGKIIFVRYEPTHASPWSNTVCGALSLYIN